MSDDRFLRFSSVLFLAAGIVWFIALRDWLGIVWAILLVVPVAITSAVAPAMVYMTIRNLPGRPSDGALSSLAFLAMIGIGGYSLLAFSSGQAKAVGVIVALSFGLAAYGIYLEAAMSAMQRSSDDQTPA